MTEEETTDCTDDTDEERKGESPRMTEQDHGRTEGRKKRKPTDDDVIGVQGP
jgi:hypothetical protein